MSSDIEIRVGEGILRVFELDIAVISKSEFKKAAKKPGIPRG